MMMPVRRAGLLTLLLAAMPVTAATVALPPPPTPRESPWNGDWVLSRTRNPEEIRQAAAPGYRFHMTADGRIRWEIPALHEIVTGRADGRPMPILRDRPTPLALSVTADGPRVLRYRVLRAGRPDGEGRMTLVDQGKAWVDISQPAGRPDLAGVVIYVRAADATR